MSSDISTSRRTSRLVAGVLGERVLPEGLEDFVLREGLRLLGGALCSALAGCALLAGFADFALGGALRAGECSIAGRPGDCGLTRRLLRQSTRA